jgi:microcystin-dependent protein
MKNILISVLCALVVSVTVIAASSFTTNLLLENPQPGDPTTLNTWGTKENSGRSLLDNAVSGILSLNLPAQAGFPSIVLTSSSGLPDQARNRLFIFSGALSQTTTVFFPPGLARFFSVLNSTTGSSLVIAVGTGSANGTTYTVPQGSAFPLDLYSDGTNINALSAIPSGGVAANGPAGGDLTGTYPNPTVTTTHLTAPLPPAQGGVPVGAMFFWTGTGVLAGYVAGDGSAQSRTLYPALNALYAAAGYPYGSGDGATTFNMPDCRGRYIAGADPGNSTLRLSANTAQGVSAAAVGNAGGEQSHIQTLGELVSHNHGLTAITLNDPGHTHSVGAGTWGTGNNGSQAIASTRSPGLGINDNTSTSTTGITVNQPTISSAGSGFGFNLIPPTIIENCLVKASWLYIEDGTAFAANDNRDIWRWDVA